MAATLVLGMLASLVRDDGRLFSSGVAITSFAGEHPSQAAKLGAARARWSEVRPSDRLTWPLHGAVTGRFGEPRGGRPHEGIDIPMPAGTPIRAASAGRVVMREWQSGYGRYTCIAHATLTTCYGHQSRFGTKLGATVRRGEVIGFVGSTGDTASSHLHFEVRRGTRPWGKAMNPARFLPRP